MPLAVAPLAWFTLLLLLLRYASAEAPAVSRSLWVPVIWSLIIASRLPSQWLGHTQTSTETAFEEGNSLDRAAYLALIVLALGVLATRRLNWREMFARNSALALLLLFALASVTWSDFPLISFKRWIRDLGAYLMVLVVLSESRPLEALSTVIRRLSCLVVLPSVVLVKYYPELGVLYNPWVGTPEYVGVTTSKNMLGAICLISGLFSFWDILRLWPRRRVRGPNRVLLVNIALLAMTLWLLNLTASATSRVCLLIGCLVIMTLRASWARANPRRLAVAIPVALVASLLLELTFDLSNTIAHLLGRDPTLTGRTGIWTALLDMGTNPLLGVGYQAFWLGDRLTAIWRTLGVSFLNEAHNGYVETYLNLGLIGLTLLCAFLVSSFRMAFRQFATAPNLAPLTLAVWTVTVFYNLTEAAFGASLLWSTLVLCVVDVPRPGGAAMPSRATAPVLDLVAGR
jgi:exopolysaccharide production protein ExoQ